MIRQTRTVIEVETEDRIGLCMQFPSSFPSSSWIFGADRHGSRRAIDSFYVRELDELRRAAPIASEQSNTSCAITSPN
jgi:hypothetical protein